MARSAAPDRGGRRARVSWCLYDWANSGFPTVIVTFVFSAYFTKAVAADTISGTAQWGLALSLSGVAIAILSPILGAIADQGGRQKPFLLAASAICIAATTALWWTTPDPAHVVWALAWFALANLAFEIGMVFYNALLPALVPPERIGRLSGWGWGVGYAGGLACLAITLFAFVQAPEPLFGLDKAAAEHIRIVAPLTAVWFAVFALPLFVFVPDRAARPVKAARAVRDGLRTLTSSLRRFREHANVARFLIARLLYTDGLNTLFAFGGIYAAGSFGFTIDQIIVFGIALNVTAGLGAAGFGWIDDWIGPKRTVLIALAGMIGFGVPLLIVTEQVWFWALALPLGIFMGPAQAASRSLMARLAPEELRNEMFGLFALSGRITAFLGPAALSWVTLAFDSQRAGMATVVAFLALGFILMLPVRDRPAAATEPHPGAVSGGSGASR